MGSRSADRGIKGNVAVIAVGGAGLDVTPALTFGVGLAAASGLLAGQAVKGGIELARSKLFSSLDLFAAFPPVCLSGIKNTLRGGVGMPVILSIFARFSG